LGGLIRFARRREGAKEAVIPNIEELSTIIVDAGFRLHKDIGPGLLESAYELILFEKLKSLDLAVDRQVPINIRYDGLSIDNAFRIDLLVENLIVIEIKSVDQVLPVHSKQVLTYLKLMKLPLGFVMNFGMPTYKDGIRRLVNNHVDFASSRLRANQLSGFSK
jgi:GxxExxY protein